MNDLEFPDNAVSLIRLHLEDEPNFSSIVGRPLRPTDYTGMVGIFATVWQPDDFEIGQFDPAVTRYGLSIQSLAKNATEEEGIAEHSRLAKKIRVMLYRDADLRVQLGQLRTTDDGFTERTQRWGVTQQRYLSGELEGQFMFLAVTDLWLETEIT